MSEQKQFHVKSIFINGIPRRITADPEVMLLEVIRDITDLTGTMCFLVGMEHFAMKVARFPHIASRVAYPPVELQPLSLADVKATVAAKAEVPIADDVLPILMEQSGGRMRLSNERRDWVKPLGSNARVAMQYGLQALKTPGTSVRVSVDTGYRMQAYADDGIASTGPILRGQVEWNQALGKRARLSQVTRVETGQRGAYLRNFVYKFAELLSDRLSRELIARAMTGHVNDYEL